MLGLAVGLWPDPDSDFSPEKSVGFVVPLVAWLFAELFPANGFNVSGPTLHPHDQELAAQIYRIMPDKRVRFLREHNFGASWLNAQVDPVYDLLDLAENPTSEFEDQQIQLAFAALTASLVKVATRLSEQGDVISPAGFISMIPDEERSTDFFSLETTQRVQEMNEQTGNLATQIGEFYRLLRRKGANLLAERT